MMRPLGLIIGILAMALALASAAQGRATRVSVRVSGSQTTQTHVVDRGCSDQGTVTGDMSESYSFRTYRPPLMAVTHSRRIGFDLTRDALTKGTITRSSTLNTRGDPVPCGGTPASCGAKAFGRLALQVAEAGRHRHRRHPVHGQRDPAALPVAG